MKTIKEFLRDAFAFCLVLLTAAVLFCGTSALAWALGYAWMECVTDFHIGLIHFNRTL